MNEDLFKYMRTCNKAGGCNDDCVWGIYCDNMLDILRAFGNLLYKMDYIRLKDELNFEADIGCIAFYLLEEGLL